MARALVIKNVDFSVNKLTTVAFSDTPCTGISLNKNSMSISALGDTDTLIATVTPSDTTDAIIWSSSNSNVATVSGGVVTATGCGTATITATCGRYSATCSLTVTHVADLTFYKDSYAGKSDNKDYLDVGSLDNYATGYSPSGNHKISYWNQVDMYPFIIPAGATRIIISSPGFRPYGFWLSSTRTNSGGNIAFAFDADADFTYNKDVENSRTVIIPDRTSGTYEGMDACIFVFRYMSGTISDEAINAITVTFTA